jgi:Ca2+-binding EF-hand superfamily protein
MRLVIVCVVLTLTTATARAGEKPPPKKPVPPAIQELLKSTPEDFIKRFDKDGDGKLSKEEAPPAVAKGFEKSDRNGDGQLDRDEVRALQGVLRQLMGTPPPPLGTTPDEVIANLLKQFDANKDGKLAKAEVKGRIAEAFDKLDQNQDGQLDRKELRFLAERTLAQQKAGPFAGAMPDFDALDKDADGRLSRAELAGTPWAARFAEIDADSSGGVDRRELERFLEKREKAKAK